MNTGIMSGKNYFTSIDDLPLYRWIKCRDGDYSALRMDSSGTEQDDLSAWVSVYDSYISRFGLGKEQDKYLDLLERLTVAICDFIITEQRVIINDIRRYQREIEDIINSDGKEAGTIEQNLVYLSKWVGFYINTKEVTTVWFYELLKEYGKASRQSNNIRKRSV